MTKRLVKSDIGEHSKGVRTQTKLNGGLLRPAVGKWIPERNPFNPMGGPSGCSPGFSQAEIRRTLGFHQQPVRKVRVLCVVTTYRRLSLDKRARGKRSP